MAIRFNKFMRPEGVHATTEVKTSPEIDSMASDLTLQGYKFEMEQLATGQIHMDCSKPGSEGPVALELCTDESINSAVERLVRESHSFVFEKKEVEFWDEDENPEEFWKETSDGQK